jgi:hypothetical protein
MTAGLIKLDKPERTVKSFKNKKSSGEDGTDIGLLKYAPVEIKIRFLNIINTCWKMHKIPD